MGNIRDRNIDSSRRDDRRAGTWDICEIINVWPHISPFPEDKNYNVCDVQLIDRVAEDGIAPTIPRIRLKVAHPPGHYGHLKNAAYTPKIGDAVLIAWIKDREGVILAQLPMVEQEPVCRSEATPEDQEIVSKRAPWECPERDQNGNFVCFPPPKHPDCSKWWPFTRDFILAHDCPNGHGKPCCDCKTPCTCLDDLQQGTHLKQFSDISPTQIDKPRRTKYHHHCGSIFYFDEDGTIHLENKTGGCDDGGSCDGATPRGQVHFFPTGTIIMRAEPQDEQGAQVRVVAKEDPGTVAVEMLWEVTGSYVRIMKDGSITLYSPTKITLDAPLVEETHDNKIDGDNQIIGFCDHNGCSCPE